LLEVTFQYDRAHYFDEAKNVVSLFRDFSYRLPDGGLKLLVNEIADAHENAAFIYGKLNPYAHEKTDTDRLLEEDRRHRKAMGDNAGQASERESEENDVKTISAILDRYGVQSLTPASAQVAILNVASQFRVMLLNELTH
jgi:hypothetical protein